ncbi:hypothetical protein ACIF85_13310 [Streptomyces sp. NPDC086033]|uniref:hypothetical protein n=1 Tax=Streptomyces sp. NPDC086033 TaxID=3365747 RepID=UPI0037D146FD
MFEIRIICDTSDVPRVAQAVLGSVDATSIRRYPARDPAGTRLYITADHRGSHAGCTVCAQDGMALWLRLDGSEQRRPCTGIGEEDMLAAGLLLGARRSEPWTANDDRSTEAPF